MANALDNMMEAVKLGNEASAAYVAVRNQPLGTPLNTTAFVEKMEALRAVASQEVLSWFNDYIRFEKAEWELEEEALDALEGFDTFEYVPRELFEIGTLDCAVAEALLAAHGLLTAKTYYDFARLDDAWPLFPEFHHFTDWW
jgi:hypothetical protein